MFGRQTARKALAASPVAAFAVGLLVLSPAGASARGWSRVGPAVALVDAVAVTAGAGRVLAATADAGVFRSDDGALSWVPSSAGLAGFEVQDVAADPADPTVAYAATEAGLFRSEDGGLSWSATALAGRVRRVVVAPSAHRRLYAAVQTLSDAALQLWRSDDGGIAWREADGGLAAARFLLEGLAVDPTVPDHAYAVVDFDLYETLDAGLHWTSLAAGLPTASIESFAVDPRHPETLYLTGDGSFAKPASGCFRSGDGGLTWGRIHLPTQIAPPQLLAVSPAGLVFAGGLHLSVTGSQQAGRFLLFSSGDGGTTWTAEAVPEDAEAIAFDPARPARAFAAGATGVLRRLSPRPVWASAPAGPRAAAVSAVSADPHLPGTLYADVHVGGSEMRTELGVYRSRNGGISWQPVPDGLTVGDDLATILGFTVDPDRARVVYAAGGHLFQSLDGAMRWDSLPVAPAQVASVAVSPQSARVLFAAGWSTTTCDGLGCPEFPPQLAALESRDGGATWSDITSRLVVPVPQGKLLTARIDPAHPAIVYLSGSRTFESRDGGATFRQLPIGALADLALDPNLPTTLYGTASRGRIFRSVDAGSTWAEADAGLPQGVGLLTTKLATDRSARAIYVGTNLGVYASHDRGATWHLLPGLPGGVVLGLTTDPFRPGVVYAATDGPGGLFAYAP